MKSRTLYNLISGLSVLCGLGSLLFIILGVVGLIDDHAFIGTVWGLAFGLVAVAVILYGLWDVGTRTIRVEEGQRRLMRDIEKVKDEHHVA